MVEADNDGETVIMMSDSETMKLNVREAFDLVTDLLRAIDQARAYGEAIRRSCRTEGM